MSIFFDILLILTGYAVFGIIHSYTASFELKKKISEKLPRFLPYYRLTYNIFSVLLFLIFFKLVPKPQLKIYDLPNPYDLLILIPQFLSLGGLIWSAFYFNLLEFLGITQIIRAAGGKYNYNGLDEESSFRTDGPYRISRHPVYLFTILFLCFRPVMSLFYLTFLAGTIIYFYAGAYFEEKKLKRMFGKAYEEYAMKIPMIFPFPFFRG
jgi:protein-S-isoprenylcysteine O-methyltransferase Ste14